MDMDLSFWKVDEATHVVKIHMGQNNVLHIFWRISQGLNLGDSGQ
jgi:hypothetical protein